MSTRVERILVVMPAFNESEVIGDVIAEASRTIPGVDLLVVNDGSSDSTSAVAAAAGAKVLELPFNLGVGGAMRLGFRYAATNGYDVVVQLDSDGQHNPADVHTLVSHLTDADVVIGARFAGSGEYVVKGPRKWAMRLLSSTLSRALGTKLSDTTSGFKAHSKRAIMVFADEYPAEYLGDTIESLVIGHRAGLKFTQHPVVMRERAGGTPSHDGVKSAVYLARAVFALFIAFMRTTPKAQVA